MSILVGHRRGRQTEDRRRGEKIADDEENVLRALVEETWPGEGACVNCFTRNALHQCHANSNQAHLANATAPLLSS